MGLAGATTFPYNTGIGPVAPQYTRQRTVSSNPIDPMADLSTAIREDNYTSILDSLQNLYGAYRLTPLVEEIFLDSLENRLYSHGKIDHKVSNLWSQMDRIGDVLGMEDHELAEFKHHLIDEIYNMMYTAFDLFLGLDPEPYVRKKEGIHGMFANLIDASPIVATPSERPRYPTADMRKSAAIIDQIALVSQILGVDHKHILEDLFYTRRPFIDSKRSGSTGDRMAAGKIYDAFDRYLFL